MLAMPGLRTFSLAAKRGSEGVSCDAHGIFVGGVPLLHPPSAERRYWTPRPAAEINEELEARYRLPIDIACKASALALIAAALNRGDLAMAAIAAVQMQFPDPPALAKRWEDREDIARRARELARSGLLKFWDPAKHPRAGLPPNPGWFAPVADKPEHLDVVPGITSGNPADKPWEPSPAEGGGSENAPRGIIELPLPGGSPRASGSSPPPAAAPKPPAPVGAQPSLPFMGEQPPQLAPYRAGGPTSGIFQAGDTTIELQSGYDGPAADMPPGSPGFDLITKGHVEGHAAAIMQQQGINEATLYINNPNICSSCESQLPSMLPPGAILNVVLPDGTVVQFRGISR